MSGLCLRVEIKPNLFLATLQYWTLSMLPVPEVFFSKKDAEKKKKKLSANVSKFEIRCQLLELVVKISSLCLCNIVCMVL